MPTCKICHRFKTKKVLSYHQKRCIPSKKDVEHYRNSKGLSMITIENKKKKLAKKQGMKK